MANSKDVEEAEIREAFDMYDLDKDGLISASELQAMLTRLGQKHSLEEYAAMIKGVDEDGDGYVNLVEFKKIVTRPGA